VALYAVGVCLNWIRTEPMIRAALAPALILAASPAVAGSCKFRSVGDESVPACSNGYTKVIGSCGRRSLGIRNGDFERYPAQNVPPWAIKRREWE
jgi:hypothetical protein